MGNPWSTVASILTSAAIASIARYWAARSKTTPTTARPAVETMTANYGIEPAPSSDHTIDEARAALAADLRRLNVYHPIQGWSINPLTGALIVICGCDNRPRETTGRHHWMIAVQRERGPQKR